jgi:serine protease Do
VVDPGFNPDANPDPASLSTVEVAMIDQSRSQGKVVWIAPGGVDLAVVTAPCITKAVRATAWPATRPSVIGDSVFAIGNPQQWGWTQAQGFLSQFRTLDTGRHEVSVIQSSAPIAPGNSGGGLYDRDGFLIGINTWVGENGETLSLSISLDTFLQISPLEFKPNSIAVEPRQKETSHP